MSERGVCEKCGKFHTRCTAHKRGTNQQEPCMANVPGWSISGVCVSHGAYGRAGKKGTYARLERERQEERARKLLVTYGQPITVNPVEAFLDLIYWSAGHVEYLRKKVQEVDADALVWGDSEYSSTPDGVSTKEVAAPSVWLKLYGEERDRLARFVKDAHTIGIEERRLQLAEHYGAALLRFSQLQAEQIMAGLVERGWDKAELEEEWPGLLQTAIPAALMTMKDSAEEATTNGQA